MKSYTSHPVLIRPSATFSQREKVNCGVFAWILITAFTVHAPAADITRPEDAKLLVAFQGKGSALAYDLGAMSRIVRDVPALRENRVIVAGNSGGSILAVYFACFGFSDETIDRASRKMTQIPLADIHDNEQLLTKLKQLALDEHTELAATKLNESIAFALGCDDYRESDTLATIVSRARCELRMPLLIVAANAEVLANRRNDNALSGRWEKTFDGGNDDVSWKPGIFEYYRQHPDEFAANAPDLRLGDSPRIGKAATYFVDRSMYDVLSRVPVDERLGDLRLVETPEDLALAILASSAEPTYLNPVFETDPSKLSAGEGLGALGTSVRRSYCGGFVMPLPAQDARRALPQLRVLGTSCVPLPRGPRTLVETWYLVDAMPLFWQSQWWSDFDVSPSEADKRRIAAHRLTPEDEWKLGWATADAGFARGTALPRFVTVPKFATAVSADEGDARAASELETRRGLGELHVASPSTSDRPSR
ncbi:MAG TPA: hypothetical protein VHV77_15350 [Pirellulales bacterium]|nr:hypothetical protein [Pirellulales bacterium]